MKSASSRMDHRIYGSVTINAKGQIVIPKDARKALKLHAGDTLLVTTKGDQILGLMKADTIQEFLKNMQQDLAAFVDKTSAHKKVTPTRAKK